VDRELQVNAVRQVFMQVVGFDASPAAIVPLPPFYFQKLLDSRGSLACTLLIGLGEG
jgi:hypothetical protein